MNSSSTVESDVSVHSMVRLSFCGGGRAPDSCEDLEFPDRPRRRFKNAPRGVVDSDGLRLKSAMFMFVEGLQACLSFYIRLPDGDAAVEHVRSR